MAAKLLYHNGIERQKGPVNVLNGGQQHMCSMNNFRQIKTKYNKLDAQGIRKKRDKKTFSRETGLEIAALCGKHFLKLKHLHYGYWNENLKVDISNLNTAQEEYTNFLISQIPNNVKKILDVGCGTGQTARKLADMEYEVDCVCPSAFFAENVRELLGNGSEVFECNYEQLQTENRYDLVLFSESFQYVKPRQAVEKTLGLLDNRGYLLICDLFRNDTLEHSSMSGGHSLSQFYEMVGQYDLAVVKDLDITEQTAANIDIENQVFKEVLEPSLKLLQELLANRYPVASKFLRWRYKKKTDRLYKKYFTGQRTGDNFKKFKSYRVLLYKKTNAG